MISAGDRFRVDCPRLADYHGKEFTAKRTQEILGKLCIFFDVRPDAETPLQRRGSFVFAHEVVRI